MARFRTRIILTEEAEYSSKEEAELAAREWATDLARDELCDAQVADVEEIHG